MSSIDFHDLADRIATDLDIDRDAARTGLESYLEQVEQIDGRTIDRDSISADDASFLTEAFRQGQSAQGLA